jgi:predicted lipoprotein
MVREKSNNRHQPWRRFLWLALATVAVTALLKSPLLFRVVPLDEARQRQESQAFNPKAFAEKFWVERLMTSFEDATDAAVLFAAIGRDREVAKEQHARTLGIGSVYYYYVAGVGDVLSVSENYLELSLAGDGTDTAIVVVTGNIFGNAIRNGTGLLDVSDFPNSRDFNNISREINRIVETRIVPPFLETVEVGSRVRFVGCAEIMNEETDLHPIRLIPVVLEVK